MTVPDATVISILLGIGGGLAPVYVTNRFTGRTWYIKAMYRQPVVPQPPPSAD